jgi:plasmid stabilization system protein ParE
MTYSLIVSDESEQDLAEAYSWYERQRAGLGREFMVCVNEVLERIQANPLELAVTYKSVRQALVRKFPYVGCFTSFSNIVEVIAVFHGHRNPSRWKSRLG